MNYLNINKRASIVGKYQVTVCGGGPAGFIAAVAAARCGARVALIERYGFLGGMATAGMVAPISEFMHEGELISTGIPYEFVNKIEGGVIPDFQDGIRNHVGNHHKAFFFVFLQGFRGSSISAAGQNTHHQKDGQQEGQGFLFSLFILKPPNMLPFSRLRKW
jgi:choline dehydrogenase-like flavoprotein